MSVSPKRSSRKTTVAIIAGAVLLIGGSFGVQAVADSKPVQHAVVELGNVASGEGSMFKAGWFGGKGHRGGHGSRFGEMSDEKIEKFVTRMVAHAAIEIEATDTQKQAITTKAVALAKELRPVRDRFRKAGEELKDLMTAETIDRTAIEALRAERMADADTLSQSIMTAMTDIAEILTPEQRAMVKDRMEQMRGWRRSRGWH